MDWNTLLLVMVGFLLFSFLLQRPVKKQLREQQELRDSISEGTRVLLTSQIFGTVTHVGEQQLIVEIAPGVEVTAMKQAVIRTVTGDDEEFEFADETEQGAAIEQAPVATQPLEGGATVAPAAPAPSSTTPSTH